MNSTMVIAVVVQFILACAPWDSQAAAPDLDHDPGQLWNIGWELSQDSLRLRDALQLKNNRPAAVRDRAALHQRELLRELLPSADMHSESDQSPEKKEKQQKISLRSTEQEHRILDELLAVTAVP